MATDYDQLYRETRHALGTPTDAFVDFFRSYNRERAWVLDVGCGQGRDALFVARLGHHVVGVDSSPSGIRDLLRDAVKERLAIEGEVADIRVYHPSRMYDAIVVDRTLHMLDPNDRVDVLARLLRFVDVDGVVLIADESKNLPTFQSVFDESAFPWAPVLNKRGYLFLRR